MRLTRGPGHWQGSPEWSPDGRSIAFDSYADTGRADVWVIGVDGTGLRQITHGPPDNTTPVWSRDGRFIHFVSDRTGRQEIWRVTADGGTEDQVTREGGAMPLESLDGRTLFYQRNPSGPLLARPTAGGEERTILPRAGVWTCAVAPRGIVHLDLGTPAPCCTLRYWDAATGEDRPIATFEADYIVGLSVSADGQSILYVSYSQTSDLMMIENFR